MSLNDASDADLSVMIPTLMPTVLRFPGYSLLAAVSAFLAGPVFGAGPARWHVEAGPSVWLGVDVQYGANALPDPSAAAKTDRSYDDGYNRVDASGNLGDGAAGPLATRTGYFGFSTDSQVNLQTGTLALHRAQTAPGFSQGTQHPDTRPGVSVNGRLSLGSTEVGRRDWGFEAGLDYARFNQSSNGAESAAIRLLTDTYALGGVVPQRAPYNGRFSPLPGDQRIGDTPTRAITTVAGTANGTRSFRAKTSVLRLGGWFEVIPSGPAVAASERDHWSLLAHAGPALVFTRADFSVDEQLQVSGLAAGPRVVDAASRRRTDIGGFAGLKARRTIGERCALLVWGDYLAGGKLTVAGASRFARLDLSRSYLLGVAFEVQWGKR
jgi:hypothetical protein